MTSMRGLTIFIGDIRNCKTKDAEQRRVDKELAHIRGQFSSKSLDGYGKKKYVWKLLYIYLMGYDVDVGHMEAMQLIASPKYSEKNAGYMACTILFNENAQLLRLIIQQVKNDLASGNEWWQSLALGCVANVGGQEFAESLTSDVQKLLISQSTRPFVKKKAALCLLRLFRKYPEVIPQDNKDAPRIIALLDEPFLGVSLSVCSLLLGLVSHNPSGYEECVDRAIRLLTQLNFSRDRFSDYKYYHTLCPWLQVKLLRLLQYFPPSADKGVVTRLNDVLTKILTKTEVTKSVNKNNADHAILFESVHLIIHLCVHGVTDMHSQAVSLLGRFIAVKEPNIRYLGLETMARLARVPETVAQIKKHQATIQFLIKDPDISIRKRALDVLYVMCDNSNAKEIIEELLKQIEQADYQFKEELVLKVAILSERYAPDLRWYIDVILKLVNLAGAFISEDIWFRVVQIVTNNEDLQEYAASTCLDALKNPTIHENGVKVGGYILGEFGHHIADDAKTGELMFEVLNKRFPTCSIETKSLLLSAFIKMSNTYPAVKDRVDDLFRQQLTSYDPELQQRAVEYLALSQKANDELINTVFDVMPNFPERESALIKRIKKMNAGTTDRNVFEDGQDAKKPEQGKGEESEDDEEAKEEEEDDDDDVGPGPKPPSDDEHEEEEDQKRPPPVVTDLFGGSLTGNIPAPTSTTGFLDAPISSSGSNLKSPRSPTAHFDSGFDDHLEDHDEAFPPQPESVIAGLLGKASGVLYESPKLQIGLKVMPATGSQCKMIVYYGNKSSHPFNNVRADVPNIDGVKVQMKPPEPLTVGPKAQVPHYFLWQCLKPFREAPVLNVTFNYGGTDHAISLRLPVLLSQFVAPTPQEPADFIESWKTVQNAEVKVLVGEKPVLEVGDFKRTVSEALHLAVIEGVEKDDNNVSLSGTFHSASKNPAGEFITMKCLLRIETKPNSKFVRVSIHSGHKSVTAALLACIMTLLNATAQD